MTPQTGNVRRARGGVYLKSGVKSRVIMATTQSSILIQIKTSTSVFGGIGADVYPHMPILRPHAAQFHKPRISSMTFTSAHLCGNVYIAVGVARELGDSSDFGLLGQQSSPTPIALLYVQWRGA